MPLPYFMAKLQVCVKIKKGSMVRRGRSTHVLKELQLSTSMYMCQETNFSGYYEGRQRHNWVKIN